MRRFVVACVLVLAVGSTGCSGAEEVATDDESEGALMNQDAPTAPLDLPFYFSVPKGNVVGHAQGTAFKPVWQPSRDSAALGLRLVFASPTPEGALRSLASADLIRRGDWLVRFSPERADTAPMVHMTMGVTNSFMVTDPQVGFPAEFVGPGEAFHIVRPRVFASQPALATRLAKQLAPTAGQYDRPMEARPDGTLAGATNAEVAYKFLSLAACSDEQIAAGATDGCRQAPFEVGVVAPTSVGGFAEGPFLLGLVDPKLSTDLVFATGRSVTTLPQGVRSIDASWSKAGVQSYVSSVYAYRKTAPVGPLPTSLAGPSPLTWVTPAVMVATLGPMNQRKLDYVATVVLDKNNLRARAAKLAPMP